MYFSDLYIYFGKYVCKYIYILCVKVMRSVCTLNPHAPPPRWPTFVVVFGWSLLLLGCPHARDSFARTPLSWTQLRHPWHQKLCVVEWGLLVRCHLRRLLLLHQPAASCGPSLILVFESQNFSWIFSAEQFFFVIDVESVFCGAFCCCWWICRRWCGAPLDIWGA